MKLCACNCGQPLTARGQRRKEVKYLHGHHWRAKPKAVRSASAKRAYKTRCTLYVMRGVAAMQRLPVP